jgi:hypothetical protein
MSTDVSEVRNASIATAIIALTMEAARISETSVDIDLRTRQYIPEDSEFLSEQFKDTRLHQQRLEIHKLKKNRKAHILKIPFINNTNKSPFP